MTEPNEGIYTGPVNTPQVVPAKGPVEAKVWASLAGGLGVGLLTAILNMATDPNNQGLITALPMWAQFILITVIPGVVPFAVAYLAPHTPRADRQALKR